MLKAAHCIIYVFMSAIYSSPVWAGIDKDLASLVVSAIYIALAAMVFAKH